MNLAMGLRPSIIYKAIGFCILKILVWVYGTNGTFGANFYLSQLTEVCMFYFWQSAVKNM